MTVAAPIARIVHEEATGGEPVLTGHPTDAGLTDHLLHPVWTPHPVYRLLLGITGLGTVMLLTMVTYTVITGVGLWGNNIPVAWAFGIINFVWWIGIGHAGTFISAILLLLEVPWRTSINRFAEGMTLFAVIQAALFPILHMGRPWFAYWLIPYPSTMDVWPQFRSSLPWDVVAVSTYFTVSLLFWYVGLIPDLAAARDRAPSRRQRRIYGVFALGWRGSAQHWRHYRAVYLVLAGLATPLVLSVHSVISLDFAITQLPGWHTTIFPPYFVAGAIYSGFAMVLTLLVPARRIFRLEGVVTKNHLDNMAKMLMVTGWIVTYAYVIEPFMGWYSGNQYERYTHLVARPTGPYAVTYWLTIVCNCVTPQLLWIRRFRTNGVFLWVASLFVQIGMWMERFMFIVTSQNRDFLPTAWREYVPTWVDGTILIGTISFFLFLFLLFLRYVPVIPIAELKELKYELVRHGVTASPPLQRGEHA